jgi:pyruvate dehydrogenase E1 component beta subunit
LLKAAIRDNDPVVFLESEKMYGEKGEVPDGEYIIPIGKADVVRKGEDVTIVSFGKIMKVALSAADELAKDGIRCEVIDLRTIRPFDVKTVVESVKKTGRCVIVEESWPYSSISSEIAYRIQKDAFDYLDAPVTRATQTDTPFPFTPNLIEIAVPTVPKVMQLVKEAMYLV